MPRYTAIELCPDGLSKRGAITVAPRLSNQDKKSVPLFDESCKLILGYYHSGEISVHNLVTWLVEDKVVLTSIIGELRVHDLPELDRQVISLFEASSSTEIHVVADISRMTSMPGIFQMTKLKYVTHPQMGYFITQSRNRFEVFIGDTVGKLLKTKYQFVKELEDGLVFLKNTDETLPPVAEMNTKLEKTLQNFS